MLQVEVLSPEKPVHRTEGVEVLLPTTGGELGIRTGHLPLLAELKAGSVVVKKAAGPDEVLATIGGFVEVFENTVYIMADSAELAANLDEVKIQEAIHRVEELKSSATSDNELRAASAQLAQHIMRMKAVQRHKNSRRGH